MWSGFWFHTSMQSSKNRYISYNLGLKIVNNKTIWYVTTLFSISSHLFTGKPTMTSSCLPAKWRRRHRACILSCYHDWDKKHWPTLTNHRKAMEMKTNKTKLFLYHWIKCLQRIWLVWFIASVFYVLANLILSFKGYSNVDIGPFA